MTPTETGTVVAVDVLEAVLQVLRQSDRPLSAVHIREKYDGPPLGRGQLDETLNQLREQGKIHLASPGGKTPRYWTRDEAQLTRDKVLELVRAQPRTRKELLAELRSGLDTGASPEWREQVIDDLIRQQRLYCHPPAKGTRTPLLSLQPLDLEQFFPPRLVTDVSRAYTRLRDLGYTMEQTLSALRRAVEREVGAEPSPVHSEAQPEAASLSPVEEEVEQLILKGMYDLEPNAPSGARVSIRELRERLPQTYQSPEIFDRAVFRLVDLGRVTLYSHPNPQELSEDERQRLLRDERGTLHQYLAQRSQNPGISLGG